MSLTNSNTVAVERRMDLASLFCMIGRHGPAVVVAVIALVSVLAGFIIYRTVRGKRRKATAAAADSDGKSPGEEGDASVMQPSLEESYSFVEATEVSDEGSPEVKEDVNLIQSDLKIRHRCAAAAAAVEKKPPPYFTPKSYIQVQENKHTTPDDIEEKAVVWDSCRVAETNAKEASQSLPSDTYTEAETVEEDAVDNHQGSTDDIIEDDIEEVHVNKSCLKEPEVINEVNHKEEVKVLKAEYQDVLVTTIKDASGRKTIQEEENNHMSVNDDVDKPQDDEATVETNTVESIHIEDTPAPCICYAKDEEFEEKNPNSFDCSIDGNNQLPPNEEKGYQCEVEDKCVDYQPTPQLAEMQSTTIEQETNLPSTQQDQSDHVTDKFMPLIQDSNWDEESVPAVEDHKNDLTAFDTLSPFNEKAVQIEQNVDGLTCSKEDSVLYDDAHQVEEKRLTCNDIAAKLEECESSSVETISALSCLSEPVEADTNDDGLAGVTTDAKAKFSGIADFPDFSSDCHQQQKEDEIATSLDEDSDSTILRSQMPLHETDKEPENNKNDPNVVLAEECTDHMYEPDVQSCFEEQLSVDMIRNEDFDNAAGPDVVGCVGENLTSPVMAEEIYLPLVSSCYREQQSAEIINSEVSDQASVAAVPDTDENITSSETVEVPCPHLPSICQDQQCDQMENEILDLTGFTSAPDTPACNDVCLSALLMAEEIYFPEALSFSQDQQIDHMENTEAFDETGVSSAPDTPACNDVCLTAHLMAEEIYFSEVLSSSQDQQCDHMVNTETFDEIGVSSASDEPAGNDANLTALLMSDEAFCPDVVPSSLEQQSDHMENTETFDEMSINSATDLPAFDKANITSPTICEVSQSAMLSSCQDQLSDQAKNYDFTEVTIGAAPVMTVDISPPTCPIYLPSFEQSEVGDNDLSSPGVGKESGISSMAVSPDLQDPRHGFDMTDENMVVPVMHCDPPATVAQVESKKSLFANDVAVSYNYENTAGMVFGPYPSRHPQPHTDWAKYESFAANEDTFGHEIEDRYHREMDQFMAQIVDSVTSLADELKEETDKEAVEELEIKEKKAQVSVEKKAGTKEEEEKAVDCEKTEISIMEATMDNNEWITDSNYQVLPWMTLSAPSIAEDQTKSIQLPTEECSVVTDVSCIDTTDDPPSTETKQRSALSLADENSENNKKVVAVQPMPQNVNVTFCVHYFTQSPYQTVAVTGNQQELGNWKGVIPLERAKDGHWATSVSLPAESHVEWKFVLLDKGEVCRWEECGNRLLDTGYGDDMVVHKWWGLL